MYTVICPYCQEEAQLTDSAEVYNGRSYGMIWLCRPCEAYVGVHRHSKDYEPLGRLADAELRRWKIRAHSAFDPLWRGKMRRDKCSRQEARNAGYRWLAEQLGISTEECHIGMFDIETCKKVVEICTSIGTGRG